MKTHTIITAMAFAMAEAVMRKGIGQQIAGITHRLDKGIGKITRKDWNANLSLKTYKELKSQGIMPA